MRYLQRASACGLLVLLAVLGMSQVRASSIAAPARWPCHRPAAAGPPATRPVSSAFRRALMRLPQATSMHLNTVVTQQASPHLPILPLQPAPAPWPADGPDCPFTVRVAGELISVADAPDSERYIVSCRSEEARRQLAALVPSLQPLTQSMPLLVGTLTREELQALCQNPVAVAAIRYIERDEKVSIAGAEVSI